MRSPLGGVLALALAAAALGGTTLACTAADEDVGEQEGAYRAKPQGEDSKIGTLLVDAPAPPAGTQLRVTRYTVASSKSTDLGTPMTGLSAGEVYAEMSGTMNAYPMIKAGATTAIHLGGVVTKRDAARPTVGVQLATELGPGLSKTDVTPIPDVRLTTGAFDPAVASTVAQAVPPGTYFVMFGFLDGTTVKVAPGAFATLDLNGNAGRRIARVVPSPSELPNARCSGTNGQRAMRITGPGSDGTGKTVLVSFEQPFEIGQNNSLVRLHQRTGYPTELSYVLPCLSMSAPLTLGAEGAGPLDLKLGRLDVDDIAVTQNDGTVAAVRGTYQVYDKNGNGMLTYPLETNTGVDLPPGSYDVVATYRKTDGTNGTWKSHFTTP